MTDLQILLIEDHPALVETLQDTLEQDGVVVDAEGTGKAGITRAIQHPYHVIVLDLGLPDMDGIEVCRELRETHRLKTPILMLTARDTLEDKLQGFQVGAHDYLCKPFAPEELEARIRALALHHPPPSQVVLERHGIRLDPTTHEVLREGKRVEVTPTGFKLLKLLMEVSPEFRNREEIEREVWGDFPPGSDALRTHIAQLRKHLDKPFDAPPVIETRYSVGVRFRGASDED